jgi:putative ABC transport system substrate-binding protein
MTRRRIGLLVTLALSLLVAPVGAAAQPAANVPRIGFFSSDAPASEGARSYLEAFRQGLRELGYVEGQTIAVEERFAAWRTERLAELAAELVRLNVEVIVTQAAPATQAARHATRTIPIVFTNVNDPVGQGIVASLARPGANVTGLSTLSSPISGKRLELLKEAAPGVARVAVFWNAANPAFALMVREMHSAAPALGLQLQSLAVHSPDDLDRAFEAATGEGAESLVVLPGTPMRSPTQVVEFAATHRLPAMYAENARVKAGGLMSYGPNYREISRRAATYVDKILKGTIPADLPVEQPITFELVINLKTAQALGLTIPPTLLFQADEVIR